MMDNKTDFGKLPPQSIKMEETVLGSIILMPDVYHKINDLLTPEMFYKDENKIIYQYIIKLRTAIRPSDLLTLVNELRKNDVLEKIGGVYYLSELTERIGSAESILEWSRLIAEKWMLREVIRAASQIQADAYQDHQDPFELIKKTIDDLSAILNNIQPVQNKLSDYYDILKDRIVDNQSGQLAGILTGFKDFDDHAAGLHGGNMIVIAGETSQGKTTTALNIADYASKNDVKVGILSYEMVGEELAARFVAMNTNINARRILYSRLENHEINVIVDHTKKRADIFIDECRASSLFYMEKTVNNLVMNMGCQLIIIDYIQKINAGQKRVEDMAMVSGAIKQLAKRYKIPIVALSQLSRDPDPKPSLRRMRWAGEIEQDADVVWLVWRPEFYGKLEIDLADQVYPAKNAAHHIIAKGRNIGTMEWITGWEPNSGTFPVYKNESIDVYGMDIMNKKAPF